MVFIVFNGCGLFPDLATSVDVANVLYKYPQYGDIKSPNHVSLGFNFAISRIIYLNGTNSDIGNFYYRNKSFDLVEQDPYMFNSGGPHISDVLLPNILEEEDYVLTSSSGSFVKDHFALMPGLEFVGKGGKDGAIKTHLNYLEVPVYALYQSGEIGIGKIIGGVGPYVAYGIGGKVKAPYGNVKSFSEDGGFKRFDAGLTFTAGYVMSNGFSVRLGYDLGLANISREDDFKAKNRAFSLNVGYSLQKLVDQIRK
jgi:hypothetical protein